MTSPSKEWKNPSDVMKIRRMKQHSSFSLAKTKSTSSIGFSRRHSFTIVTQNCENNATPQLKHSQNIESLKRKNPFGCDMVLSNHKRRSVLDQDVRAEHSVSTALFCADSAPYYTSVYHSDLDKEANCAIDSKQNRLLFALNLQEQKNNEADPSTKPFEKFQIVKPVPDVLKEKPVILNTEVASSETHTEHLKVCPSPPVDWSLKSKVRVVVQSSAGSFKKYPGIDAKNVDGYIHHKLDNSQEWKDLDIVQQVRRCCMHYSYPHLPWLSMFPRLSSDFRSRSSSAIANSKEVVDSFQKDWSSTFTSVYQQLRGGLCPYFYVCAHQFSVLFRCLRSPDSTSWSAMLSPSTRGLREMLTKEGIEFRMPNIRCAKSSSLHKHKENEVQSSTEDETLLTSKPGSPQTENLEKENSCRNVTDDKDDSSDDDNDINGDDDASLWLEGMGLDKKDFPSLEPLKVKLQREGFREIDNRPQSLVYVEGVDVHSFFNFLLNYSSCIASSGPQHGIPPTILSPVSFAGGRLVQNVVKHTTLSDGLTNGSGQLNNPVAKSTHVFEISGPVLPHHILNIASILHSSPDCESSTVSFSTHSPSAAFNVQIEHSADKDMLACGLSKLFVELSQANHGLLHDVNSQLLASPVLDSSTAVREMHISKSGYSWIC